MAKTVLFFCIITFLTLSSASERHLGAVSRISVDKSKTRFLTCSFDNTLRLWDVHNGDPLFSFDFPRTDAGQLFSCALSSKGGVAAAGGWSATGSGIRHSIHFFRLEDKSHIYSISGIHSAVLDLEFSPDGTRLAAGLKSGGARVYDVKSGRLVSSLQAAGSVYSCGFDKEGNLVVASSKGVIRIYGPGLELKSSCLLRGERVPVSVVSSSEENVLAVGMEKPAGVVLLSLPSLEKVQELLIPQWGKSGMVQVGWLEGKKTVIGSFSRAKGKYSSAFFRWDLKTGRVEKARLPMSGILDMKVLPDGTSLFGGLEGDLGRIGSRGEVIYRRKGGSSRQAGRFSLKLESELSGSKVVSDSVLSLVVRVEGEESLVDVEVFVNGKKTPSLFTRVLFELHSRKRRVLVPLFRGKNRIVVWGYGKSGRSASTELVVIRRNSL
ncbi:MAG: hypothetical protein ACLFQB_05075 [Chitinispirillaceae bacterium]